MKRIVDHQVSYFRSDSLKEVQKIEGRVGFILE